MAEIIAGHQQLKQMVASKLTQAGLREEYAETVADVLVHADLRGVHSLGVMRTEHYIKRLKAGGLNPNPKFSIKKTSITSALFNGDDGMGHVA